MTLLALHDVTASYGRSQALFGMDLTVEEGAFVALMGRNGMGKTTTVKTICRMLPNGGGRIEFAGQDITRLPSHKVARLGIGLTPEGRRCFPNLTVWENLTAAATSGVWDFEAVSALFPRLAERRDQMAASLSGGEQQRVAIARAVIGRPDMLVADEPTGNVDPDMALKLLRLFESLNRLGTTVVVATHDVHLLQKVPDRFR